MSEIRVVHRVSGQTGPNPMSLLPFHDPAYESPTNEDLRAITQRFSLSGAGVARLTGVLSRTVRKWMSAPTVSNHSPIPYAAWRLLLIESGTVQCGAIDSIAAGSVDPPQITG
jgi:hypothetical protein